MTVLNNNCLLSILSSEYPFSSMLGPAVSAVSVFCALLVGFLWPREKKVENNAEKSVESICAPQSLLCKREAVWAWLALITILAGALRWWGLDFGLPFAFHPDETRKARVILSMLKAGDANPHYFLHPSLLLYLTVAISWIRAVLLKLPSDIVSDIVQVLYSGRCVSFIAGTLSVPLLFAIGRQLYSSTVGLLAAALLAVCPLAVTCSRYLKEDALLVCLILMAIYCIVRAGNSQKRSWLRSWLIVGAVVAGLATGAKYTGVLVVAVLPLLFGLLNADRKELRFLLVMLAILAPCGFFLTTPFALLAPAEFLDGVRFEKEHMITGHQGVITAWSQFWMYHLGRSLAPGMTWLPLIIALVGCGYLLKEGRSGLATILLVLVFYLPAEWVRAKVPPQPERYVLPVVPFLALAAAAFIATFINQELFANKVKKYLTISLLVSAIAFPLARSAALASELSSDTRLQLRKWMLAELPRGSRVRVHGGVYGPPFKQKEFVTRLTAAEEQLFLNDRLNDQFLSGESYQYLVMSSLDYERYFSQPAADPNVRAALEELFAKLTLLKELRPCYGTYGFHNPTLRLYQLKSAAPEKTDCKKTECKKTE